MLGIFFLVKQYVNLTEKLLERYRGSTDCGVIKMDFDKMTKECMKPHALAHSISGAGVALIVVSFLPALAGNALMAGVVILLAGIVFDFWAQKKS